MAKFSDIHLQLEKLAEEFREDPSDEKGNQIIAEICRLIQEDASILIDGIPSPVNPNVMVPSGYYAPDGRFYFHLFSSRVSFDRSVAEHPFLTHMSGLMEFLAKNPQVGGCSLNPLKEKGTILITREDIEKYQKENGNE